MSARAVFADTRLEIRPQSAPAFFTAAIMGKRGASRRGGRGGDRGARKVKSEGAGSSFSTPQVKAKKKVASTPQKLPSSNTCGWLENRVAVGTVVA